jgi:hypothetical protein
MPLVETAVQAISMGDLPASSQLISDIGFATRKRSDRDD